MFRSSVKVATSPDEFQVKLLVRSMGVSMVVSSRWFAS
jgi:hypothetical protein